MTAATLGVLRFRRIDTEAAEANWLTAHAISEAAFSEHLRTLTREGWSVIGADDLVAGLQKPETLPERAALLTIDGPYRSFIRFALPVLRSHRFPAVLFVPTDFIGRRASFEAEGEPEDVCTWSDLQYLMGSGVSIQSQGLTRRRFFGLDEAEQEREATLSKEALEAALGPAVHFFAYPRGDPGPGGAGAEIVRRAGYRAAFVHGGGVNELPGSDIYRLARVTIGPDTELARELAPPARGRA